MGIMKSFSGQHSLFKTVDGIIFMGYHLTTERFVQSLLVPRTPVVLLLILWINRTPTSSVNIDYKQATIDAVSCLLKKAKDCFCVGGPLLMISMAGSFDRLQEALKKLDILIARPVLNQNTAMTMAMPWQNSITSYSRSCNRWWLAAGVLNGLADHGVSVPEGFKKSIRQAGSQIARYSVQTW